ncbi:MAG: hypothetical protein JNG84_08270 [Archangium sp.]|nr:hypothetical protein [Archangium sp.]
MSFSASGGAGGPYTWSLVTAGSGAATINSSGSYRAGPVEATDVIRAIDGLGNIATATITVTNALAITPPVVTLAPRASQAFTATGGSAAGYAWTLVTNASGATFDAGAAFYTAGPMGGTTDSVRVTDSLGAVANATITIGPGVTVAPATATITPRGVRTFVASGGSGTGFTWALSTNASGGAIDAAGSYTAGTTGGVTDVVTATDSLGNTGSATLSVSPGVTVTPTSPAVPPRGALAFTAAGGTGFGFTWTFADRRSGNTATVDSLGQYQAGTMGGVVDVIRATDSAGNVGLVNVTVTSGIAISPAMPRAAPLGVIDFTASGGADGGYSWQLRTNASQGTIDAASGRYAAGAIGNTTDVVEATDTLGNTASVNVLVSSSVTLMPAVVSQAPRSTRTFTVTGGTAPFTWGLPSNGSGASISDGGVYTAGPTPNATDVVQVTDAAGIAASATVNVTAGVSLTPAVLTLPVRGTQTFVAAGGSGTGFSWAISTNASGGSIDESGLYTAGRTAGVDVVLATDSLGNTASANVTVNASTGPDTQTPFAERPPVSGWSCGCEAAPVDAASAFGALAVFALARRGRRRVGSVARSSSWRHVAALALVLLPALALAAPAKKATAVKPKPPAATPAPAPAPAPATPPPPVAEPAPTPPVPAPATPQKPSVAVLDVEVTVPNEKLDAAAFSEMLVSAFDGTGLFRVTSAKDLATMLGLERQRQLMGCSEDSSCMAEFANALGTDLVLVATVGKVADNYLVTVRLIDGRRSRVAARGSVQSQDANLLLSAIWSAAQQTIDTYGNTLPPEQANAWAKRPRQAPPEALVSESRTPSLFGVTLGAVGGYQLLSNPGQRGTIGVQIDGTWRLKRFDLGVGLLIGPNIGARLTATWALIDARFRLMAGLRGSTYPGLLLFGGGPALSAEFAFTPWLAASAVGGTDFFPASSGVVIVLLGTVGAAMHF